MSVRVKMNMKNIKQLTENQKTALAQAVDAAKTELMQLQIMPFDTGQMQNTLTFIDESKKDKGEISIVTEGPYAERLYFHPEFNFQHTKNKYAASHWFEPFISGSEKDFIKNAYETRLRILNKRSED